jgi:DNA-binding FadR family transcriptional regulator
MAKKKKIAPALHAIGPKGGLRIHGALARDIGVAIVTGRYRPGDVLPNEIDASDRLNVSRTAYREAIRILSAKGLVVSRPKSGTRVNDYDDWHLLDPDMLAWIFEGDPDQTMVEDLFELRQIVEPEAAALAAARRTEEQVRRMEEALNEMAKHTLLTEEGRLADRNFHATMLEASENRFLISLTTSVSAAITLTTVFKQRRTERHRDPIPDHRKVFEAIKIQDSERARSATSDLVSMAFFDATRALNVNKRGGRSDGSSTPRRKSPRRTRKKPKTSS